MNILYFDWGANNSPFVVSALRNLGHTVFKKQSHITNYDLDSAIMQDVIFAVHSEKIDCIFTLDYIPLFSSICNSCGIPYYSWTFDSPQFTLYSPVGDYSCNHRFIFDREEYEKLTLWGKKNIHYLPLASSPDEFRDYAVSDRDFSADISFLGSLYDNTGFSSKMINDPYKRGFVEGLLNAQKNLYGCNLIRDSLSEELAEEIICISGNTPPKGYLISNIDAAAFSLEKHLSGLERFSYLKAIGEHFHLDIYSGSSPNPGIRAKYHGFVDYKKVMPKVFCNSKININIAPRNIHSGVSLRVFDVLACKGFLLTSWQSEIDELFEVGKELIIFEDTEDLIEKCHYYLNNDNERKAIAEAGYKKVSENFTYEKALEKILASQV